ncbi:MAG: multiheme c-type cytochrome [Acidobacteriota bacterium]
MESAKIKADSMAKIYSHIGVDAVNLGERDLALGIPFLKELEQKWDFPFVSANLVDANGTPIFSKYIIREVAGRKVGIFGIIGDESELADMVEKATDGSAKIEDPLEAAEAVIAELSQNNVDYVIALAHQKSTYDWRLARRVDGINLIVGSHDKMKTEKPKKAGETLMVQAGEKGQYQGMLDIMPENESAAENSLVPYGEDMEGDPEVKAMITEYNDKIVSLYSGNTGSSQPSSEAVELRASNCQPCHPDPYQQWSSSDHAKAYSTLVEKSKQFDPSCLVCHTTLFEKPGGFTMKEQQPELMNVQCETCHGYAKDHLAEMKPIPVAVPPVATCIKCHTADRCPGFEDDYDTSWQKIAH